MHATLAPGFAVSLLLSAFGLTSQAEETIEKRGPEVGDAMPVFECRDDRGEIWRSSEHVGQKVLVLYFFPSDFSFCCTRQAARYCAQAKELAEQGIEVV